MKTKIVSAKELAAISENLRAAGKKLVATNGCFDLLHVGHVRYLKAARELGDALVVGINGDASVKTLKGNDRPLNGEHDRAELVAALESVDHVTIFPEERASRFLEQARPAIYVKGGDYQTETLNTDERAVLEKIAAEIQILPFEAGYSTTALIKRLQKSCAA
jgi:D-glycero-beta-D-manno-heptose 1-phosphate adenylyltransferase